MVRNIDQGQIPMIRSNVKGMKMHSSCYLPFIVILQFIFKIKKFLIIFEFYEITLYNKYTTLLDKIHANKTNF